MNATPIPDSLEDAIYSVVHESGDRPPKALAAACGCRPGYLLDAANPNREDTQFQARLIVPLTKATGNDAIVRFLSQAVGGLFVRLEPTANCDAHTARSLKEFGDYLHAVADSQADGAITVPEFAQLEAQVHEVIAAVVAHVHAMRGRVRGDHVPAPLSVRRPA